MGRKKAVTLTREVIGDKVRLTSNKGIRDIRTESVYFEVICKAQDERFFVECE